jgi:hypothetical protein
VICELKTQLLRNETLQALNLFVFKLKNLTALIAGQVIVVMSISHFITSRSAADSRFTEQA